METFRLMVAGMNVYPISTLRVLAETFCSRQGITPGALGQRMKINEKLFPRLLRGKGCTAASAETASAWFDKNWPEDLPWPIVEAAE